jgi:release factor glutamine methyltransferase
MPKGVRVIHKTDSFNEEQTTLFQQYLEELMRHRPVQYVLAEAWFGGLSFYVDENVLIPRPETEELVDWVLKDLELPLAPHFTVLDIGTGSGCIPVSIGKKQKSIRLLACDISPTALAIARKNSMENEVAVDFFSCDIRDISSWDQFPGLNLLVSNPPYIPERQRARMDPHVKNYEPELALFVPDRDPLLYYIVIGQFAKKKLVVGGKIFLELHHDFARNIVQWYRENGFIVELRKDLSGNNRMIRASLK